MTEQQRALLAAFNALSDEHRAEALLTVMTSSTRKSQQHTFNGIQIGDMLRVKKGTLYTKKKFHDLVLKVLKVGPKRFWLENPEEPGNLGECVWIPHSETEIVK